MLCSRVPSYYWFSGLHPSSSNLKVREHVSRTGTALIIW